MRGTIWGLMLAALAVACLEAKAFEVQRRFVSQRDGDGDTNVRVLQPIDEADWIGLPEEPSNDHEFFRLERDFKAIPGEHLDVDVSADERFVLLLDGVEIARGPHRGFPGHWHYQSYRIECLEDGEHTLAAVCWRLGAHAPVAQLSWRSGFVLKAHGAYDETLTTGTAPWKIARLHGTSMTGLGASGTYGAGDQCEVFGADILHEQSACDAYSATVIVRSRIVNGPNGIRKEGWRLYPSLLPDMKMETLRPGTFCDGAEAECLLKGVPYAVASHTKMRLLWDLGNYYCAYPQLSVSGGGGAKIVWKWAESLLDGHGKKGNRNEHVGKSPAKAMEDVFRLDGRSQAYFTTPWWRCGRWCEIVIETADEPLEIRSLSLQETRYPLESQGHFECDDAAMASIERICVRGMQMCTHEMSVDCPYYEQQMYPGDSRVQFLTMGVMTGDDRIVRQNISLFDHARRSDGMIAMNFPTRIDQESSTYSMCWLMMLGDFLRERSNDKWLRSRVPGMRHTLAALEIYENKDGMLVDLPGWSFVDWCGWWAGVPPSAQISQGVSSVVNLQYAIALKSCASVEAYFGEVELAARLLRKSDRICNVIMARFWNEDAGLVADSEDFKDYSEHAQCLAILADTLTGENAKRAFAAMGSGSVAQMKKTSVYFSHYLFEACFKMGRPDVFLDRMSLWKSYLELGLKTPLECPGEDARSDCHAWGAHPLYHFHRGLAGIRSSSPGFRTVQVAPCPGRLKWIKTRSPHPSGTIAVDLAFQAEGTVSGTVELPRGVRGTFKWQGKEVPLSAGVNEIGIK